MGQHLTLGSSMTPTKFGSQKYHIETSPVPVSPYLSPRSLRIDLPIILRTIRGPEDTPLSQIGLTHHGPGLIPHPSQTRHQNSHQHCDHGNHNQQFNKRKRSTGLTTTLHDELTCPPYELPISVHHKKSSFHCQSDHCHTCPTYKDENSPTISRRISDQIIPLKHDHTLAY